MRALQISVLVILIIFASIVCSRAQEEWENDYMEELEIEEESNYLYGFLFGLDF